jgi:hypothetical protein
MFINFQQHQVVLIDIALLNLFFFSLKRILIKETSFLIFSDCNNFRRNDTVSSDEIVYEEKDISVHKKSMIYLDF